MKGFGAGRKIFRLDSLADEPYENFISFDRPDSEAVDEDAVFQVSCVAGDMGTRVFEETKVRHRDSAVYLDAGECEECAASHLTLTDPASVQQEEVLDSSRDLPSQDLIVDSTGSGTAEKPVDNALACPPDAQIKDKANCVIGANVSPGGLHPLSRLEDSADLSPPDKNNCHSVEESVNVDSASSSDRRNSLFCVSEDSVPGSFKVFRYDPIGLSMASYRSSDVVCHCRRSCRRSSLRSDNSDVMAATPKETFVFPTPTSSWDSPYNQSTIPSSPIHILSASSSKSSVSSFFSLAPEGERFWDDILLGSDYTTENSEDCRQQENLVGSATTDSGWSDGDSMLSQSFGVESVSSISKPSRQACLCKVCGCADRANLQSFDSGPFSPMWDWTFPTIEDVAMATDPAVLRDPGDYKLGLGQSLDSHLRHVDPVCEQLGDSDGSLVNTVQSSPASSTVGTEKSAGVDQTVSKSMQRPSSLSLLPPASELPSLTLSDSDVTQQSSQPVVTFFNHSVNFWKMEID
ncbi:hypothetical protein ElyMa_006604700 [Elysia marginata]|uniref:Uncharacterized protein n=1 Tax=Elysia marginata TaxID=1093978 RepID=A0AAV4IE13_9GAST|nr:hypothetical protein ElyMa_006604700 [Elysia marginata]